MPQVPKIVIPPSPSWTTQQNPALAAEMNPWKELERGTENRSPMKPTKMGDFLRIQR